MDSESITIDFYDCKAVFSVTIATVLAGCYRHRRYDNNHSGGQRRQKGLHGGGGRCNTRNAGKWARRQSNISVFSCLFSSDFKFRVYKRNAIKFEVV